MSGEPVGFECPGCQEPAAYILPGQGQAMCGNENCHIVLWIVTQTLEEAMSSVHIIDLGGWP